MYQVVSYSSLVERLNELLSSQGSVQVDSERASMVPPRRNQFTPHEYFDSEIGRFRPRQVLFWGGPYHQQFMTIGEMTPFVRVDDPGHAYRREDFPPGVIREPPRRPWSYRLRQFECQGNRLYVYECETIRANPSEIRAFFRSLGNVFLEYESIIDASGEVRHSIERRQYHGAQAVRESVYQEILEQVRREFAERERRQPPAAPQPEPTILPTIDTDQGRSIVL